jgi:hypothetical protein
LLDKAIKRVTRQLQLVCEMLQCRPQYFCVDRSTHFAEEFHHALLLRIPEFEE